ncbi:hypothetical protein SSP35_01_02430 [Streptomyces sp. NBRC 110611]|nr:hypothetical protein SSP35_01_02430 [Streptomyces sp. NBRC 110611]
MISTTPQTAAMAMPSTSHCDMETSYEERRPEEPDEELERGRRAAPASTAGAVISRVVVTRERPLWGERDACGWLRGRAGVGEGGGGGVLEGGGGEGGGAGRGW